MNVPVTIDMLQEMDGNLQVPEIRVWCHPHRIGKSGDDYYEVFDSFEKALNFISSRQEEAEDVPLIAFRGYEINLWEMAEKTENHSE